MAQSEAMTSDGAFRLSPYVDGSKPFRPGRATTLLARVQDGLGLDPVRLHDLGHFSATQLTSAGIDVRVVATRIGHSDPSMTLRALTCHRGTRPGRRRHPRTRPDPGQGPGVGAG
ncbi:MAG: tyrosine-type recombinase/integrase [Candidatus Dormibacteraeota bacterium]|nr:tyrosine-type recombinase/integrase [Candidatus Dormibacteraeota bacterium]